MNRTPPHVGYLGAGPGRFGSLVGAWGGPGIVAYLKPGYIELEGDDSRASIAGSSSMDQTSETAKNQDISIGEDLGSGINVGTHHDVSRMADCFA